MKSIRMKFITEDGKNLFVSMDYAAAALAEEGGAAKVKAAVDAIIANQPFAQAVVKCETAELIDRSVTAVDLTPAA
ncbi:MAG: DUF2922 family protein [Cloacibacillus sp.]